MEVGRFSEGSEDPLESAELSALVSVTGIEVEPEVEGNAVFSRSFCNQLSSSSSCSLIIRLIAENWSSFCEIFGRSSWRNFSLLLENSLKSLSENGFELTPVAAEIKFTESNPLAGMIRSKNPSYIQFEKQLDLFIQTVNQAGLP